MIPCDPNSLNQQAACFECFDDKSLSAVKTYLMCQWANAGGGVAPAAPVANPASNCATTSFSANWSASAGATSYHLDVSTSPVFAGFVPGFNNLNVGNVTSFSVTGLAPMTQYYYRVRASNANGTSANSGTQTFITSPSTPTNLLIDETTTNGNIILNWTAGAGNAPTNYEIWVSINGGAYALLDTISGAVTTYTDTNSLGAADQWYYEVRGTNASCNSAFTDPAGIFNGFTHTTNTGLTDYTFPFLQFVIGDFFVQNQSAMTTVSVPKLHTCTGFFVVNTMPVLTSLVTTSLKTCTIFATNQNTVLTSVSLPAFTANSSTGLFFGDCPALVTMSAPLLTTVVGDFDGRNNPSMTTISAGSLASISGDLFCRFAGALTSVTLTSLATVASINFEFSGGFVLSLPALTTVGADIRMTSSGISSFTANSLTSVGGMLDFTGCAFTTLSVTSLATVGSDITIISTNLTALDFPALTGITAGALFVSSNTNLNSISAAVLADVGHDINTDNNTSLASISFPSLTHFGNAPPDWISSFNPALTSVDASVLAHAEGGLNFDSCPSLISLSFPALTLIDGDVFSANDSTTLVTVSASSLIYSDNAVGVSFINCALDAASVNEILARCVASGLTAATIDLSGGTSSAPTGQGIIDAATLTTAGCSVTTN